MAARAISLTFHRRIFHATVEKKVGVITLAAMASRTQHTDPSARRCPPEAAEPLPPVSASLALTWRQVGLWKDDYKLFEHAARVTEGNYFAYNHMGLVLAGLTQIAPV